MGQEGFAAVKRGSAAGAASLPTTNRGRGPSAFRGRQIHRTFNNIKITILCGFVTILVLRGTIGVGNLGGAPGSDADTQKIIEETNRIIAEIRSDGEPEDFDYNPNVTYTLGPKISNWDEERKAWLAENPQFPNYVNDKARILLVTGSPPKPCDNPIGDHYLLKSTKNKIDYCRIHGIEIVYNMAHLDKELAGYWAKLPLIRRLMLSHPEVEWIWWMDSDAFFTDMVFELPLAKYNDHNMVIHGYPDLLFDQKSWIAVNTGSFLFRNCQWSLDLLDDWAPMGPKGPVREEAGKILTANLKGRPAFEADDQSALIYLFITKKDKWMDKVFVENSFYLHGYWAGLVDQYEEMIEKHHPGLGDERWPFVTHFVGCKPCGSYGDYAVEKCLSSMEILPPMEEGGLLLYLRVLAVAYEKTQELARDLRAVGCGDLDIEGLTESLFAAHKDEYPENEQASLKQLYQAKMEELCAESQSESSGTIGRSKGASVASSPTQISVTVVTEFVRWNEEAISRCNVFSSQPAILASNVRTVFTSLLEQVSQYITDGLERARDSLTEAAALRERFVLGTSMSRRVAAAAASAAEAAAVAGENSFKSFMVAVQRCGSSVAIVQQYFANSMSRLLLPVDGAHAAACEEMATAMSSAESAAYKGLQQCIETVIAEVDRLLSAEQKATDYRSPDDGMIPDHRPTTACTRVVAYLSRVLESAFTALEGLNKQAFLTELGNRLHKGLINHWQKFTFNPSGGLRLKRDITEYGEFVRSFNAPSVDEKFELLGIMANVFIVAPESLSTLFEGSPAIRKDAQRFIQLREDYKSAKLATKLASLWPS